MSENPLLQYTRRNVSFYKLPTAGSWYFDDTIEYNQIGEVEVLPMISSDELLLVNPDGLLSGQSLLEIIRSCCPGIKKPENLYYPDVNFLLLAIRKATYGDEVEQKFICPKCLEKKNKLIDEEYERLVQSGEETGNLTTPEEFKKKYDELDKKLASVIAEKEKNGEFRVSPQVCSVSASEILNSATYLPPEKVLDINGLKVHISPFKCSEKIKFMNNYIQQLKITSYIRNNTDKMLEFVGNEEKLDNDKELIQMYNKYTELLVNSYSTSVIKVVTPDSVVVEDREFIKEFLRTLDIVSSKTIKEEIEKLNGFGIQQTIDIECSCCGHTWEEKFYGYNQSDFFGISS